MRRALAAACCALLLGACAAPPGAPHAERRGLTAARLVDDHAVTLPGTRYVGARFSPDGRSLALARVGLDAIDLADPAGDGSAVRPLVAAERAGYRFAWTPDSRAIVHRDGQRNLDRTDLAGRVSRLVAEEARVGFPVFGSRGRLFYTSGGTLRTAAGGVAPAVAHPGLVTVTAAAAPVLAGWDGREIFVVDLERGARHALLHGPGFFDVELSRDGRLALVSESRGALGHLWIATTDGPRRQDLGVGWHGRLSPDGRFIVYVLQENDGLQFTAADLYLMTSDGAERVRVTATPDVLEIEPAFAPDGRRLAYVDAATGQVRVGRLEWEATP